jgi:hypothetical protein
MKKIKLTESQLTSLILGVITENKEIDRILDKINSKETYQKGFDSLTDLEKEILANADIDPKEIKKNSKNELIKKIKDKLEVCGVILIAELQLNSDIVYAFDKKDGIFYIVVSLEDDIVNIIPQDGDLSDSFEEPYEVLDVYLLSEIWESIKDYDCESDVNDTIVEYYDRDKLHLKEPLIRKLTMKDGKGRFLTPKNIRDHIKNLVDVEVEDSFGNVRVYVKVPEVVQAYLTGRY